MKQISLFTVAASVLIMANGCKPKYDTAQPKMAPVTEAVFASGSIEPKDAYILTSISDGFITKAYVTENDLVHDNQLLFRLDNRQQNTQVHIARTNLQYAAISASNNSPALQQTRAQMEAARVKMVNDSVTLQRYKDLYATHSVSKQDLDNADMNFQSSYNNYVAAVANNKIAQDKVNQDLTNNKELLQNAEAGDHYFTLVAIGESKVYQIFKKQGDLVRKGDQVAQLGNPDSIVVNLDVDEGNIAKVALGQQVLVELNTEKNVTYEAIVSKIYPHFNETSQSYKVEARFLKDSKAFIAGTQLQANIITGRKPSAMVIPRIYLMNGNMVLVQREKKIDTVRITTGIFSDDWVEVTSGLNITDKLAKLKQ